MASETTPDASLDITMDVCPMTFVKTKLELEELEPGQVLEVLIREGEALENVARSCAMEGDEVIAREERAGGVWRLLVRRGGA